MSTWGSSEDDQKVQRKMNNVPIKVEQTEVELTTSQRETKYLNLKHPDVSPSSLVSAMQFQSRRLRRAVMNSNSLTSLARNGNPGPSSAPSASGTSSSQASSVIPVQEKRRAGTILQWLSMSRNKENAGREYSDYSDDIQQESPSPLNAKKLATMKRKKRQHPRTGGKHYMASTTTQRKLRLRRPKKLFPVFRKYDTDSDEAAEEVEAIVDKLESSGDMKRNTCWKCDKIFKNYTILVLHKFSCGKELNKPHMGPSKASQRKFAEERDDPTYAPSHRYY